MRLRGLIGRVKRRLQRAAPEERLLPESGHTEAAARETEAIRAFLRQENERIRSGLSPMAKSSGLPIQRPVMVTGGDFEMEWEIEGYDSPIHATEQDEAEAEGQDQGQATGGGSVVDSLGRGSDPRAVGQRGPASRVSPDVPGAPVNRVSDSFLDELERRSFIGAYLGAVATQVGVDGLAPHIDIATQWAFQAQQMRLGADAEETSPPPPTQPVPQRRPQARQAKPQPVLKDPRFKPIVEEVTPQQQQARQAQPQRVKIVRGGRAMWVSADSPEGREALMTGANVAKGW